MEYSGILAYLPNGTVESICAGIFCSCRGLFVSSALAFSDYISLIRNSGYALLRNPVLPVAADRGRRVSGGSGRVHYTGLYYIIFEAGQYTIRWFLILLHSGVFSIIAISGGLPPVVIGIQGRDPFPGSVIDI